MQYEWVPFYTRSELPHQQKQQERKIMIEWMYNNNAREKYPIWIKNFTWAESVCEWVSKCATLAENHKSFLYEIDIDISPLESPDNRFLNTISHSPPALATNTRKAPFISINRIIVSFLCTRIHKYKKNSAVIDTRICYLNAWVRFFSFALVWYDIARTCMKMSSIFHTNCFSSSRQRLQIKKIVYIKCLSDFWMFLNSEFFLILFLVFFHLFRRHRRFF